MKDLMLQKLPPQCIEAEEAVLSAALLGSAVDAVEILSPDDFYRTAHGSIFGAMGELVRRSEPVDLVTVTNFLRESNKLEEIGGAAYLARLVDTIPSAVSLMHYAELIRSASQKRKVIAACNKTIQECYNGNGVSDILGKHDSEVNQIKTHSGSFVRLGDVLESYIEKLEQKRLKPGPHGIPCGLIDIDKKFGGFQGSTLYVVAARPGMGKTAFGMRVARGAAERGFPVLQISLEMSTEQLLSRELSCQSGVDGERFTTGEFESHHWSKIIEACGSVSGLPLWVDDTPQSNIKEVQSKIRHFCRQHGRCMVLIDYLDYIKGVASERKDLEIGTITKGLKASAKEHDIPIILFVQLNRQCEQRDDKRPTTKDLRNSGEIEQDADVIAFLYRDEYYDPNTDKKGIAEFIVRKYRQGKVGTVLLSWISYRTTFENLAR